ncbi:hypothetical protein CLUG_05064 [Clavispora lusitaniae ATCC 42720]|uniref:Uncharacterized protein n=1 Tax=Clavispora lusitaniae (strain ATCC 42720) TaxID=306902 RepID=C4YAC6_CLAL4|nr:uncharacterized protein CLUG_05064 [Clavispora lusitaniae ATCC 42720]EEQ40937.1 hypothetical protein CLUG_05064 [Clavispora lusitaniae ATCC 42720]
MNSPPEARIKSILDPKFACSAPVRVFQTVYIARRRFCISLVVSQKICSFFDTPSSDGITYEFKSVRWGCELRNKRHSDLFVSSKAAAPSLRLLTTRFSLIATSIPSALSIRSISTFISPMRTTFFPISWSLRHLFKSTERNAIRNSWPSSDPCELAGQYTEKNHSSSS